jgi:hypothetical protein
MSWDEEECDDVKSVGVRMYSARRVAGCRDGIGRRSHPSMTEGGTA